MRLASHRTSEWLEVFGIATYAKERALDRFHFVSYCSKERAVHKNFMSCLTKAPS